jgi:subtilisin family serine protease
MTGDQEGGGDQPLSRRNVLKATSGAIAVGAVPGAGSAEETIEVNVGYENTIGIQSVETAAENVKREFNSIPAKTIEIPVEELEALENNPNITFVEKNGQMHALAQDTPYGIEQVEADVAIDNGDTGDGVDVAVVDTGVDAQHETLEPHLGTGYAATGSACQDDCTEDSRCRPNDISTCYEDWDDDNNHGTHVAGTVGAVDNGKGVIGVAPDVTIHPVKVLDCCGSGGYDAIAEGIEWVADQGYDVINMSLGGDQSSVVSEAVEYAASKGVVIVAAAGNDGECTDCVGHPAAHEEVIAVSAVDENDDLTSFSSTGPEVELAAPGQDVLSSIPRDDYDRYPGTSMASPHVAGGAAQVVASGTTDRTEVRQTLRDAAKDIGLPDNEQGYGRLNVLDAVNDDSGGGDDPVGECVDASNWPAGSGTDGYENIDQVDLGGQVVKSSAENAYEDFTCPDPVYVQPGGSFQVTMDWDDNDYDDHYASIHVDWDQNQDWSTASETVLMQSENDSTTAATTTVDVPSDAPTGPTLLRVRLSWQGLDDPAAEGEYGEVNDFTVYVESGDGGGGDDPASVTASTGSASNVGETSATLSGSLDDLQNADQADVYFEYGKSGNGLPNNTATQTLSSTGSFTESLSGLESGTDYEFRAVATAGDATDTGSTVTFTTDSQPASVSVSTDSASGVGTSSSTLNGSLTDLQNASSADVYFEYGQSGGSLSNTTATQTLSSTGSFDASISGLSADTSYDYRAVASAGNASDSGITNSFTTDQDSDDGCFITTATAREPQTLNSLRRFRDSSMKETPVGRSMVGLYYRISPPIANTLDRHPESRTSGAVRSIVQTCAELSDAQDETDSSIKSVTLAMMLTQLYIVGILVATGGHAAIRALEKLS